LPPQFAPAERQAVAPEPQGGSAAEPPAAPTEEEPKEELFHIPCPGCGYDLETPKDMLGQDAQCPHCSRQFRLKRRDSREYKEAQERKEQEFGRKAVKAAIVAAVIVGLGLATMVIYSLSTGPDPKPPAVAPPSTAPDPSTPTGESS
jgi:hypothetical protein